ncbi:unnamed protein product [Phaeothamnion confervicola]
MGLLVSRKEGRVCERPFRRRRLRAYPPNDGIRSQKCATSPCGAKRLLPAENDGADGMHKDVQSAFARFVSTKSIIDGNPLRTPMLRTESVVRCKGDALEELRRKEEDYEGQQPSTCSC